MERPKTTMIRVGNWCVNPALGEISRDGETARLEARTMRLLVCLAERAGEVVSIDELLDSVWAGVMVTPDSVYQAVTSLRRVLGDDPKAPSYIATVPRLGYRMVAEVRPWVETVGTPVEAAATAARPRAGLVWAVIAVIGLVVVGAVAFVVSGRVANGNQAASAVLAAQSEKSVAVLPFLDLTEGMHEEEFADGMTEELIGRLSKIAGLRVPAPTASFYFKGKQLPVAEIAKTLGVAYVLDGSVRKAGDRVRVAARLVRAETGYVVWSGTYDRPFDDILMVQDDIAGEVTKALRASIGGVRENRSK